MESTVDWNSHLNFFFNITRHSGDAEILNTMQSAWEDDPCLALMTLFQKRDCRGGSGERKPFITSFKVLPQSLRFVLYPIIPNYGYWDDLNALARTIPEDQDFIAGFFAERIVDNMLGFEHGVIHVNLEKWLPTEHQEDDKEWGAVKMIIDRFHSEEMLELRDPVIKRLLQLCRTACQKIDPDVKVSLNGQVFSVNSDKGFNPKIDEITDKWCHVIEKATRLPLRINKLTRSGYRKWCTFMRAFSSVTEHYMTEDISLVDYSQVPSISFRRNKEYFAEHDKERFEKFTEKKKYIPPHQLLIEPSSPSRDEQWRAIVEETKKFFQGINPENPLHPRNAVHIVDISKGPTTNNIGKSLAILMSEVGGTPVFTISQKPKMFFPTWKNLTEALEIFREDDQNLDSTTPVNAIYKDLHAWNNTFVPKSMFMYEDRRLSEDLIPTIDYIEREFSHWPTPPIVILWDTFGSISTSVERKLAKVSGFNKNLYKTFTRLTSIEDLEMNRLFQSAVLTESYEIIKDLYNAWKEHN